MADNIKRVTIEVRIETEDGRVFRRDGTYVQGDMQKEVPIKVLLIDLATSIIKVAVDNCIRNTQQYGKITQRG